MQPADIYRQMVLDNGVEIVISDLSRNYFGDYHLVRLEIVCRTASGDRVSVGDVRPSAGVQKAEFRKVVERMGVPSGEVESVRAALVQSFLDHSLVYMNAPDFPAKLSASVFLKPKMAKPRYAESKA